MTSIPKLDPTLLDLVHVCAPSDSEKQQNCRASVARHVVVARRQLVDNNSETPIK